MASGPRVVLLGKAEGGEVVPLPTAGSGYTGLWLGGQETEGGPGSSLLNGFVDLVGMQALATRGINRGHSEIISLATREIPCGVARVQSNRDLWTIDSRLCAHIEVVFG